MLAKLGGFTLLLLALYGGQDRHMLREWARMDMDTSICQKLVRQYIASDVDPPKEWFDQNRVTVQGGGCYGLQRVFQEYYGRRRSAPTRVARVAEPPSPRVAPRRNESAGTEATYGPDHLAQYSTLPTVDAPDLQPLPDDAAICAGDGVGWLQVTRHPDGRLGYKGRAPGTLSRPAAEIPERDDVLEFPDTRPGLIHRDPAPCILEYEAGCESEPIRGRYVVAARTRFAVDIGGREQWQLCLMPE